MSWQIHVKRDESGSILDVKTGDYFGFAPAQGWEAVAPFEFEGTITPDGYYKGRSAMRFSFKGPWPTNLPIGMDNMNALIRSAMRGDHKFGPNGFTGKFKFVKQGTFVGMEPVK